MKTSQLLLRLQQQQQRMVPCLERIRTIRSEVRIGSRNMSCILVFERKRGEIRKSSLLHSTHSPTHTVFARVRPLNDREKGCGARHCIKTMSKSSLCLASNEFTFDRVLSEDSEQSEVFEHVGRNVTEACLEGYNGCIFSYGQTGSGKTFTIMGDENNSGLLPRVVKHMFERIEEEVMSTTCKVSFLEIYNEHIFDLLADTNTTTSSSKSLDLRESKKRGVYVENLNEIPVKSVSDAMSIIKRGISSRRVAETRMNRESSRSHCVFTFVLETCENVPESPGLTRTTTSRFHLIDLAGSERLKSTKASGTVYLPHTRTLVKQNINTNHSHSPPLTRYAC